MEEAFAPAREGDGCPMLWVSRCWGETNGYNTRKSAFWRVIRATTGRLGVADVGAPTWPSFVAWSNLYKVSPSAGGNPSSALANAQLPQCIEILRAEIHAWAPRRVLFLTGRRWARPFLDGLGFVSDSDPLVNPVEASGTVFNGARIIVGPHPQAKPEGPFVDAAYGTFQVAQPGDAGGRLDLGRP